MEKACLREVLIAVKAQLYRADVRLIRQSAAAPRICRILLLTVKSRIAIEHKEAASPGTFGRRFSIGAAILLN